MLYFIFTAELPTKHLTTLIYADVLSIWHSIPTYQLLQVFFKTKSEKQLFLTTQEFICSVSPVLYNISLDKTIRFLEDGCWLWIYAVNSFITDYQILSSGSKNALQKQFFALDKIINDDNLNTSTQKTTLIDFCGK